MAITTSSIAHVRFTVTDIERSRQFYESVFGWQVLIESPDSADEATREALSVHFAPPASEGDFQLIVVSYLAYSLLGIGAPILYLLALLNQYVMCRLLNRSASLSEVARRYGIAARVLFRWKQELMQVAPLFVAVEIADATPSTEEHAS